MSDLDDALNLIKRDPVRAFVSIPIIGARAPNPQIVVKLKGRSLVLPDWTAGEWAWYGHLAFDYADSVDKALAGARLVDRANGRLTSLNQKMRSLGTKDKPTPKDAADYYDAAVRLVIATHVASDSDASGPLFVDAVKASIKEAPAAILAFIFGKPGTAAIAVGKEAARVLDEIFDFAKFGLGLIAIVAVGWWLWNHKSNQEE